jgi:ferredoxin
LQLSERDEGRKEVVEKIASHTKEAGLAGADEKSLREAFLKGYDSDIWEKYAEKCVECGACNFVCPTCHCFALLDVEEKGGFKRFKNWDSCLYPGFARVAGGANPRERRAERLRNRIEKKFDFFVQEIGRVACTGCGRCSQACAGQIKIQDILKDLSGG